jgi:small-conductance mechanosensitive channel
LGGSGALARREEPIDRLLDAAFLTDQLGRFQAWLTDHVLTVVSLLQLVIVAAAFVLAWWLGPKLGALVLTLCRRRAGDLWLMRIGLAVSDYALPIVWLAVSWLAGLALSFSGTPDGIVRIAVSLLAAWVAIGLVSRLFRDRLLSRAVAVIAWSVAALNILGVLDATVAVLDSAAITFGAVRISALTVIKGVLALAILLWAATVVSGVLDRRIQHAQGLTPSIRVLFTKLIKILLMCLAVVAALQSVGMDLSAFTVFTGALGVGLGFGLQKTVANLFSGVLILMDRSIKPGDIIEVGDTYGWVNALSGRYVSVATRDGIEHLIPNEDFITQRVANWSYTNDEVRLKAAIGIAYDADVRRAMEQCVAAALETARVLQTPRPLCVIKEFGDNAVNLELRFWIKDPRNGITNVRSQVMLGIWDKFHAEGIRFPYPQRDVHLSADAPLPVRMEADGAGAGAAYPLPAQSKAPRKPSVGE